MDSSTTYLSQLTFSDEWVLSPVMHPEDVDLTPGSVIFPQSDFDMVAASPWIDTDTSR